MRSTERTAEDLSNYTRRGAGAPRRGPAPLTAAVIAPAVLAIAFGAGTVAAGNAGGEVAPAASAVAGAEAPATERRRAPWALTGVGRGRRALTLVYEAGGCWHGDGTARVREGRRAVRVAVVQTRTVPDPDADPPVGCNLDLRAKRLRVTLDAPIGGRWVRGGPLRRHEMLARRVPRVLGLSRRDATRALDRQGYRVRVTGAVAGRVVKQAPRPGVRKQPAGRRFLATVKLRIAPHSERRTTGSASGGR